MADHLVAAPPPRHLESIIGALLPSSRRQDVLGDLCERYVSPARYLLDALQLVPVMAVSHVLRRLRRVAQPAMAAARRSGQERAAVALVNWLALSRPVLFFGGWYVLLSLVSALNWMRGRRHESEPATD